MKNKSRIVFASVVFVLILAVGISSSAERNISFVPRVIGNVFSPVVKVFYNFGEIISSSYESLVNIYKIREENNQLRNLVSELREENRNLKSIVYNSEELMMEYRLLQNMNHDYIKGRVTGRDPGNWVQRFIIDIGEENGIKINDLVIKAVENEQGIVQAGLVGKIIGVGSNWAKVITISDPSSKVSFKILRNNLSGVISGKMNENLEGYLFNQSDDVQEGDEIVTSGLGEIYIPEIYIGKIVSSNKTEDLLTEQITVKPEADINKIFEVYVIKVNRE